MIDATTTADSQLAVECIACGEVFDGDGDIERTRDAYVAHISTCTHTRSRYIGWTSALFAPGPYSQIGTKR